MLIHYIRPESHQDAFRYDEFGTLTTVYRHNLIPLTICVLKELSLPFEGKTISSGKSAQEVDFLFHREKIYTKVQTIPLEDVE